MISCAALSDSRDDQPPMADLIRGKVMPAFLLWVDGVNFPTRMLKLLGGLIEAMDIASSGDTFNSIGASVQSIGIFSILHAKSQRYHIII